MRLRQVAFIAEKIAPIADQLGQVFGLEVGFRDPGVEVFGLKNVVMPVGGEFLEVLEPFRDDASGARYLARRGGDAGYMVILQDADAQAHRTRLEAAGVRVIARSPDRRYQYTHFHPADCAGVLLSIDSVVGDAGWREPTSDWPPAGPNWRDHQSTDSLGIASVTIQARDPVAAAERWSMLLDKSATRVDEAMEIALDPGVIRFVQPVDADATGVVGLDIVVDDRAQAFAAARKLGLPTTEDSIELCGVAIRPVKES
jgi:Glyoxalase-like domain